MIAECTVADAFDVGGEHFDAVVVAEILDEIGGVESGRITEADAAQLTQAVPRVECSGEIAGVGAALAQHGDRTDRA